MPSGQQLSEKNLKKFLNWRDTKSEKDFRQYVYRNKLSRKQIAVDCEFARSVLNQNPKIKQALYELEVSLIKAGILHSNHKVKPENSTPKIVLQSETTDLQKRLSQLENENVALKAENAALKGYLKKYDMLASFLSDTMRIPR